jgi:hypothetical protein
LLNFFVSVHHVDIGIMNDLVCRIHGVQGRIDEPNNSAHVSLRRNLADASATTASDRCYSAAELIGHAADLLSDSAGLVHGNERRWRMFRARVAELVASDEFCGMIGEGGRIAKG